VVDEWETLSADAMRWAPPEHKEPDLLAEVTEIFSPLAEAISEALRPIGDSITRALDQLTDDD
ncbi:MAG: hypothetical protein HOY71_11615, partial [Nonomuraea sp.]|nr:hypothetical protein [Nonomuraea sp.]